MNIPQQTFKALGAHEGLAIPFWVLHALIKKHYCAPMTQYGHCPRVCAACAETIQAILDIQSARSVSAVTVYRCRAAVARIKDESQPAYTPPTDPFGDPIEGVNPFQQLGERYK